MFSSQDSQGGVKEHLLFDRFQQVTGTTQRFHAGSVTTMTHGCKNEYFYILHGWITLDGARSLLAIHARHLHVEQNDVIRVTRSMGVAETLQSFCAAGDRLHAAPHRLNILGQYGLVGFVIIDDQDMRLTQVDQRKCKRRCMTLFNGLLLEFDIEPEGAAYARLALHADSSSHCLDQLFADRKSQARSAIFSRRGSVRLCEAVED